MSDLLVRTYGMGEFTAQVFNAVALTVDNPGFKIVLSGAFLISMAVATYQFIKVKDISILAKNIFLYIFVVSLLLIPKYKVTVHDDVIGNNYGVANVPMGLAFPAYLVTNTFYGLTNIVETMFHWPDDQSYSKTGFLFASNVVRSSAQVKTINPELNKALNSYLAQCVFYDIYLGRYTLDELLKSNDMWEIIKSNASKNRAFMLNNEVTMCNAGVAVLDKEINNALDDTFVSYSKAIFPWIAARTEDRAMLKAKLLNSVGASYSYLTGVAKGGAEILKQNILINALQDAALNNPELGMYSYAATRANAQKTVANTTTGLMMARWLPVMTGATETMIYALFILVVIYALFTNGEKVFFNYVMTMVWVGSWPVVYAILNFGFTWAIRLKSYGSGLSFYDSGYLSQTQYDMSSLFGYFTILVPYIAWGMMNLAKQGLGSVFTQMSQLVGSSTQSLSMAASNEAVTGNMQFANTSFDNHSMFNSSSFKHDSNMSYQSGAMTTQLASGSTITRTTDGTSVVNMEPGISRLNTGINASGRISASVSEQADKTISVAQSEQISGSESTSSSMRSLYDVGHNINSGTNLGESFSKNTSGGYAAAASEYAAYIDKFAQDNNISTQEAIKSLTGAYINGSVYAGIDSNNQVTGKLAALFTGVSAGGKISAGAKGEKDHSWSTQDAENYSKAIEFIKNNNLTKTFDTAIKGIEEHSYRSDMRDGINMTDSMSASLDKAIQLSKSYSSHVQESQSLREFSNFMNENSASFNVNESQDFLQFVASKPIIGGSGAMGANRAEVLLRSDPKSRNAYAEEFIIEKTQSSFNEWKTNNISKDKVQDFANSALSGDSKDSSSLDFMSNKNKLMQSYYGKEIDKIKIDDNLRSNVKDIITNSSNKMDSIDKAVKGKGGAIQDKVDSKVKDEVNI